MAAPARTPLGEATLTRKWWLDINTGTYAAPTWTPVSGISNFVPKLEPTLQEDSDYDSAGYKSQAKTALAWSAEFTLNRKVTDALSTVYDPGQEALRTAGGVFGASGIVDIRWYEVSTGGPITEAFRGFGEVSWSEDGGAMDALDTVSVVVTGRGARAVITHPDAAAVVPVVTSIAPATGVAAGGEVAYIAGQFFTGVVSVKIGVTAVTDYQLVSDFGLAIITPAKVAATYTVYVENATGSNVTGPTFVYT
jgi:hypothetical protein